MHRKKIPDHWFVQRFIDDCVRRYGRCLSTRLDRGRPTNFRGHTKQCVELSRRLGRRISRKAEKWGRKNKLILTQIYHALRHSRLAREAEVIKRGSKKQRQKKREFKEGCRHVGLALMLAC